MIRAILRFFGFYRIPEEDDWTYRMGSYNPLPPQEGLSVPICGTERSWIDYRTTVTHGPCPACSGTGEAGFTAGQVEGRPEVRVVQGNRGAAHRGMAMNHCRIGKVRLRNGGAEVRVLDREALNPNEENWRGKIIAHARQVAGYATPEAELVGFVIIGLFEDGSHSFGWRYDSTRSPIPRRLMASYVAELIREEIIVDRIEEDRRKEG